MMSLHLEFVCVYRILILIVVIQEEVPKTKAVAQHWEYRSLIPYNSLACFTFAGVNNVPLNTLAKFTRVEIDHFLP